MACGIPGLISGLAFLMLPESPRFLLSIGKHREALRILEEVIGINQAETNARAMELQGFKPSVLVLEESNRNSQILKEMWYQTKLLFSRKYLKITFLTCYLQVIIFSLAFGMYMCFPDIVNSAIEFTKGSPGASSTICDVYGGKLDMIFNQTHIPDEECSNKFDVSTYSYSLATDCTIIFSAGFFTYIVTKVPIPFLICEYFWCLVISSFCCFVKRHYARQDNVF